MKMKIGKEGYTLLEIIVAITIFSIFSASIVIAFSSYTNISTKNNLIATERIKAISKLEEFLATDSYDKENDTKTKLIIESGFSELPDEIEIYEREETIEINGETFKAFIISREEIED